MVKHDWSVEDYEEYRKRLSRESQQRRREKAIKTGMCLICCKNKARKGKRTCEECSARIAGIYKSRRDEYRSKGMCLQCGERPPVMYRSICEKCIEQKKVRREKDD